MTTETSETPSSTTRTDEVLLSIEDVSLTLGGRQILSHVSAQVKHNAGVGSIITLLGPSGIGKTQLSWIIAGLRSPNAGRVTLRGGEPTGPGKVCIVPQTYPMFEWATVEDNLKIAGKVGGLPKNEIAGKMAVYVETFGLGDHLRKYPRELSGGTKQRVAIARQLMCSTHVLILDEPFSGLDPLMKKRALDAIVQVSKLDEYSVILIVTHDVTEGMSIADNVWVMGRVEDGARIVQSIDMAGLGLAWRPGIESDPDFISLVLKVKAAFSRLV